jgi:hypothetical protein
MRLDSALQQLTILENVESAIGSAFFAPGGSGHSLADFCRKHVNGFACARVVQQEQQVEM